MLELLINGEPVDLAPDASITIDEESPVFDKDSILGGYSFPFNLPITPRNSRVVGFPERIEKAGVNTKELPYQLYHDGILRASGSLSITESDLDYKANLIVGSGNLASRIKDKKLKDLDLGGERIWEWKSEYKWPEDDFALFPIHNETFMQGEPVESGYSVNLFKLNAYANGEFTHDGEIVYAITPFPFLTFIIRRIMGQFGFQIQKNILESHSDFRDLVIYNNFDITQVTSTTEMVDIHCGFDPISGEEIIQEMEVATIGRTISTYNLINSLPDMLISDFLLSLRNLLNIAYIFDAYDHVSIVHRQEILLASLVKDITSKAIGTSRVQNIPVVSGFKLSWTHDQNDSLFKDGFKKIDDVLNFVKEPVADFTVLATITPIINEIRFVQILDAWYQYGQVGESNVYQWQKYGIGFQNYLDGLMQEIFESKFSTLLMKQGPGPQSILLPCTEQLCNSATRALYQVFSPRLLFYRGMQLDSNGDPCPMGSNHNLDRTGQQLEGKNLSLKWDGDYGFYGLYPQLWKQYMTWWVNRKWVFWTIKDPSALSFGQKYMVEGNQYLLKKRTTTLTMHEVTPGECEFYLV